MNMRQMVVMAGLAASVATGSAALAQMVTPPPAQPPQADDGLFKAPPPPPAPPQFNPTNVQEIKATAPAAARPRTNRPQVMLPDDFKFQSLATVGADGKVAVLTEPVDLAALRVNPLVDKAMIEKIAPILAERKATFRKVIVDNLDLVEQVEDGVFEKADLTKKESYTSILNVAKPLRAPATPEALTEDLSKRQMLTAEQAEANRRIVKDYNLATTPRLDDSTPEAERAMIARRGLVVIFKQSIEETMWHYRGMQLDAASNLGAIIPSLKLDPVVEKQVTEIGASIKASSNEAQRLEAVARIKALLTPDQRRMMFRAVIGQ